MKIFLGISGASGVNLGLKLASEIAKRAQLHLCVSKNAMKALENELNFTDFFRKNGENLSFVGENGGKFAETSGKFSAAADVAEILNSRASQNADRFGKIYGDTNDVTDFQNAVQNLNLMRKDDSREIRDGGVKSINLASSQGLQKFNDHGEFAPQSERSFCSDKNSQTIEKFDSFDDCALDDANGRICQNTVKFDERNGSKNTKNKSRNSNALNGEKYQNQSGFDKNLAQNKIGASEFYHGSGKFSGQTDDKTKILNESKAEKHLNQNNDNQSEDYQNLDKFKSRIIDKNAAEFSNEFDAIKYQNQSGFDKNLAQSDVKAGEIYKFGDRSDNKNEAQILGVLNSEKNQNDFEEFYIQNGGEHNKIYQNLDKFEGGGSNKNAAEFSSEFDVKKSQNQNNFDKKLAQNNAKRYEIYKIWQSLQKSAEIYDDSDLAAAPSSGSFGIDAVIVAPCSVNTLAKIHAGLADTLITRAVAVAIKERKKLVLGVREMPFSTLSLEHAAKLSNLGAIIAPPVLAYYSGQESLEEMENFIVGKWLDLLGLEHQIYKRWRG